LNRILPAVPVGLSPVVPTGTFTAPVEVNVESAVAVSVVNAPAAAAVPPIAGGEAKLQTKDRLRAERAPLLAAQDVAFQRALEESKDTATIVAEKQRLRDITNLVDGCKTTEELRGLSV